jgi:hypothetical protein
MVVTPPDLETWEVVEFPSRYVSTYKVELEGKISH